MATRSKARSRKSRRMARESGQAAVFLVLAMGIFLIGGVGFVVDGANLWFHRQSAQTAADAACTAGAMDMLSVAAGAPAPNPNWIGTSFQCSGSTSSGGGNVPNSVFPPCQYAGFNGYTSSGLKANQAGNNVSVTFPGSFAAVPSCSGSIAVCSAESMADTPYIQASVTDRMQTTFIGMLNGGHTVDVGAKAICGLSNVLSPLPVVVLNPTLSKTLAANSGVLLTLVNGPQKSIQVNSTDADAVSMPSGNIDLSVAYQGNKGTLAVAGRESQTSAGGSFSGNWVDAAGVISDPFASLPEPAQPIAIGTAISYVSCPGFVGTVSCTVYSPGYWASPGIAISGLSIFKPGLYYLDGDLSAVGSSCIRPDLTSPSTTGTTFYFHGAHTLQVHETSGGGGSGGFDCSAVANAVPLSAIKCSTSSTLSASLPSTGLTGNVLLGPCEAPVGDPQYPYGDPLGTADPAGEQRGMLFFQSRDSALLSTDEPKWHSATSFGLVGNVYFHQCNSTASSGNGANCDASAFNDVFALGSSTPAYVVGNMVVDQLQLGESAGNSPITVVLNPHAQYYTLKASLLQ